MPIAVSVVGDDVEIRGVRGWSEWTFVVRLCHKHRTDRGEPTVVGFDARSGDHGQGIRHPRLDADTFRRLPFGTLRRLAVGAFFDPFVALLAAEVNALSAGGRPTSEQLADVYRMALDQGFPPRAAVARHFEVSEKSASRWLTEARQRGRLGSYEQEVADSRRRMRF